MLRRRCLMLSAAALAVFGMAAGASAQNLLLTGEWFQNRGPLVDIPINGGPSLCFGGNNPITGCNNNFRPANGGIPAVKSTTVPGTTGTAQPRFTLPVSAFAQALPVDNVAVAIVPTVVQLDTHFSLFGPGTEAPQSPGTNPDRIFSKGNWVNQTGRLAGTFNWCPNNTPGSGISGCGDPRPSINGNTGPQNGIIRYSNSGGNFFGGTMSMLLDTQSPIGAVWVVAGTGGGPAMTPLLLRQGLSGMGRQHPGGGYAITDTDMLSAGPIFLGFMTSMQTAAQTGLNGPQTGLITAIGPQVTAAPADANVNTGMPWTTGMVIVQDIETNMGAMATTTITQTGKDTRGTDGAGRITMVAGGTSFRVGAGINFKAMDMVTMVLPEPGAALALGASLALIGGLHQLRRRF